jgi:hypothetical protein
MKMNLKEIACEDVDSFKWLRTESSGGIFYYFLYQFFQYLPATSSVARLIHDL